VRRREDHDKWYQVRDCVDDRGVKVNVRAVGVHPRHQECSGDSMVTDGLSNYCGLRGGVQTAQKTNATEGAEGGAHKIGHSGQQPTPKHPR